MNQVAEVVPSAARTYYERVIYWTNFDMVQRSVNRTISGDDRRDWIDHVRSDYGRCDAALSLNCGNGWVERELFQKGAIRRVIGMDISQTLLAEARNEADRIAMPSVYESQDVNRLDLSGHAFTWAINHAALHHVAYIDHVVREVCRALPEDGLFLNYDYVGAHRNQYDGETWQRVIELNAEAPKPFQIEVRYPHQRTMLHVDPTEAIHSELIVSTLERYFDFVEVKPLGGALLYSLLFGNTGLHAKAETAEAKDWLRHLMYEDARFTQQRLDRSLFAFIVARPRKSALDDERQLLSWTAEEHTREEKAKFNGGRYYAPTAFEILYEQIYALQDQLKQIQNTKP